MIRQFFQQFIRLIIRRKLFKGQFRLFLWLNNHNWLTPIKTITKPIIGNFNLQIDTSNFIESCIYHTGDYEPYLKKQFAILINDGDCVLDVGANIGFHTMYFAELAGNTGKIFAFEPIPVNFLALKQNLSLNGFGQITAEEIALGNETNTIKIHIDPGLKNPGAYTLLSHGKANTYITCVKGDEYLDNKKIDHVDFIKIDVEGYEYEVLKGLKKTIAHSRPIVNFEYDRNYQLRQNEDPAAVFNFFADLNYTFYQVDGYGKREIFNYRDDIQGAEIIAFPKA